jgi:transposase
MQVVAHRTETPSAIRSDLGAIFVSLELSRSTWLITSLSPGGGEKMSKHSVPGGDIAALLARFSEFRQKAFARTGTLFPIIVIQEAGLDGFWIHRVLQNEGIESHVVDPASIATSRRRRRAKTDRIDGEALLRALLAYKRGEPRVCAMVKAPSPEEEDRRRLCRERKALIAERILHVNRIKGLLFSQVSTPERFCSGGPEQKCSRDASNKAPDIGGLIACGVVSKWRRPAVASPLRRARPLLDVTGACCARAGSCHHSFRGYERDA